MAASYCISDCGMGAVMGGLGYLVRFYCTAQEASTVAVQICARPPVFMPYPTHNAATVCGMILQRCHWCGVLRVCLCCTCSLRLEYAEVRRKREVLREVAQGGLGLGSGGTVTCRRSTSSWIIKARWTP